MTDLALVEALVEYDKINSGVPFFDLEDADPKAIHIIVAAARERLEMGEEQTFRSFVGAPWVPAFCRHHESIGPLYPDGSGGCYLAEVIEMGSMECVMVPARLFLDKGET